MNVLRNVWNRLFHSRKKKSKFECLVADYVSPKIKELREEIDIEEKKNLQDMYITLEKINEANINMRGELNIQNENHVSIKEALSHLKTQIDNEINKNYFQVYNQFIEDLGYEREKWQFVYDDLNAFKMKTFAQLNSIYTNEKTKIENLLTRFNSLESDIKLLQIEIRNLYDDLPPIPNPNHSQPTISRKRNKKKKPKRKC